MRQGLLAAVLFLNVTLCSFSATAIESGQDNEVTQAEVNSWLSDSQVLRSVDDIYKSVLLDKPDEVQQLLESTPLPYQEAVRFLLLKKMENEHLVLTSKMAQFVQSLQKYVPVYTVSDNGNGYTATMPVLNSALIANRLIFKWDQDKARREFLIAVEKQDLNFLTWLKGQPEQIKNREAILIAEADKLSPAGLQYLVDQLIGTPIIEWVPSSGVVVKLARLTSDKRLYDLLWKMRVDYDVEKELKRLIKVADGFSINQLILATKNPTLKPMAIKGLIQIQPTTSQIQEFLLTELNHKNEQRLIATQLMGSAHQDWLMEMLESDKVVNSQFLLDQLTNG